MNTPPEMESYMQKKSKVTLSPKFFSDDLGERVCGVQELATQIEMSVTFVYGCSSVCVHPDWDKIRRIKDDNKKEEGYKRMMEG